jgi:hypothetical protein
VSAVRNLFRNWSKGESSPFIEDDDVETVMDLSERLFDDYEPDAIYPFLLRLEKWIGNVESDDDKKVMVSLLSNVFFSGRDEFESLCQSVFSNIQSWIIKIQSLSIESENVNAEIAKELKRTWICPITDSLRINAFLKVNKLEGHVLRPDWRSLKRFSDIAKIIDFCKKENICRIALLEDFIGSGVQSKSVIRFACETFPEFQIFFAPLIICPSGDLVALELEHEFENLTYEPGLVLPAKHFGDYPLDTRIKI